MSDPNATPPAAVPPKLPPFFRNINPDESAPVVDRTALAGGVVVRYVGTREVIAMGRPARLHTFYARGVEGVPFAVLGSSGLDSQLRKLRGGTGIVFLRYNGKVQHPTVPDRTVHKWTVQEAVGAKLDHVRKVREQFADAEGALDGLIAAAAEQDKQRLLAAGVQSDVPPLDDDDLPF